MMELSGQKQSMETILLSGIFDKLSWLAWTKTQDAQKGINQPKSIMSMFHKTEKETKGFDSGEDFIRERNKIISSLKVVE